jgi:hypothetical protein
MNILQNFMSIWNQLLPPAGGLRQIIDFQALFYYRYD